MYPKKIGAMIRFHRKKAKLSQSELATFAGLGKTVVFDIEQGKETVRISTLMKILNVLNISIQFQGPLMSLFAKEFDEKG
jgi:y4mF family transcriptional regulator